MSALGHAPPVPRQPTSTPAMLNKRQQASIAIASAILAGLGSLWSSAFRQGTLWGILAGLAPVALDRIVTQKKWQEAKDYKPARPLPADEVADVVGVCLQVLGSPLLQRALTNVLGAPRTLAIAISVVALGALHAGAENWLLYRGSPHYGYRTAFFAHTAVMSISFGVALQVYGLIGVLGGLLAFSAVASAGFYVERLKNAPANGT